MAYKDTLTGENATKRNIDGLFQVQLPAQATAVDGLILVGVCPFAGVISSVKFYPNSVLTGADTNTRLHKLFNRKSDNSGTTVAATLQYNNAVNAAAKQGRTIALSGTPANLVVAAGDVLEFSSSHVGTGLADPGGLVVIQVSRT